MVGVRPPFATIIAVLIMAIMDGWCVSKKPWPAVGCGWFTISASTFQLHWAGIRDIISSLVSLLCLTSTNAGNHARIPLR